MKRATNPTGKTLIFKEEDHSYTIKETGQKLQSCTQFVKSFFPEFDSEFHSKRVAEDYEILQEEVLQLWKERADARAEFGSRVHAYAEAYIKATTTIYYPDDEEYVRYCQSVRMVLDTLKADYEFIDAEKMLFSERLGLAGTTDLLFRDGKTLLVLDWKTNREITKNDIFKHWKSYMGLPYKAKPPIEHIEDCKFNKFSLQLNIYKRLIEEENYFPEIENYRMLFFHVLADGADPYKIKSMETDIEKMLGSR
jgi:ATP-dependent exoDNAse (exonuclease V) beta subunit